MQSTIEMVEISKVSKLKKLYNILNTKQKNITSGGIFLFYYYYGYLMNILKKRKNMFINSYIYNITDFYDVTIFSSNAILIRDIYYIVKNIMENIISKWKYYNPLINKLIYD